MDDGGHRLRPAQASYGNLAGQVLDVLPGDLREQRRLGQRRARSRSPSRVEGPPATLLAFVLCSADTDPRLFSVPVGLPVLFLTTESVAYRTD